MTIALRKSTAQATKAFLAAAFHCDAGEAPVKRALIADHIRSAIYANTLSGVAQDYAPALPTTRLLTAARKAADLVWPGTAIEAARDVANTEEAARQTLDGLSAFGDVVDTGGGYWIGTPMRFVPCDAHFLVLGCSPNAVIKAVTGTAPICAGISRMVEIRPSSLERLKHSVIPLSTWFGSNEEIGTWTRRILAQHELHLLKGDEVSASQLEVFAPDLLSRTQRNPWLACADIASDLRGLRLCRPLAAKAFAWERPHYLAKFSLRSGELAVLSYVKIDPSLRQRLRFGLARLANAAQVISASVHGDIVELEMPRGLPDAEARIAALGWAATSDPRRLRFHRAVMPLLSEIFERLGIKIIMR